MRMCVCVCVQILYEWFCWQILILQPGELTKCLQFLINRKNQEVRLHVDTSSKDIDVIILHERT